MSAIIKKILLQLLLLMAGGNIAFAQDVEIQLITVSPGADIYALDGHTALRFIDRQNSADYTVNWGVFDFGAPNFLYRFVKGETDYMAWAFPTDIFLEEYRTEGRTVTAQTINLSPDEALSLQQLVAINLLPENRTYRYNYIYDNCATRPLELIEKALDAGSKIQLTDVKGFKYGETGIIDRDSTHTFRGEMTQSHADYPWYQFGIDLALGSGLDKKITNRERTYSPLYLHDALTDAKIIQPDGASRRLVSAEQVILAGGRVTEPATPGYLTPLFTCGIFLIITLLIAIYDLRRRRVSRWFDSIYYSIAFLAGLFLTFLVFVSVHEATSPNWLLLWLNPFCIIPAIIILIKRWKCAVYCYQICNFVALFLLLIIGACGLQMLNPAFYMLIAADMLLSIRYILIDKCR